jgi:hypothetical protein
LFFFSDPGLFGLKVNNGDQRPKRPTDLSEKMQNLGDVSLIGQQQKQNFRDIETARVKISISNTRVHKSKPSKHLNNMKQIRNICVNKNEVLKKHHQSSDITLDLISNEDQTK